MAPKTYGVVKSYKRLEKLADEGKYSDLAIALDDYKGSYATMYVLEYLSRIWEHDYLLSKIEEIMGAIQKRNKGSEKGEDTPESYEWKPEYLLPCETCGRDECICGRDTVKE